MLTYQNKAVKANDYEQKKTSITRRLAKAEEGQAQAHAMLRDFGGSVRADHHAVLVQSAAQHDSLVESLKAELDALTRAEVERAEYAEREPALYADAVGFKTDMEQHVKALLALSERGKKLGAAFRSTVVTTERGYLQLRDGRFKSAGGCWLDVLENPALVESLKRFLRDAAECKAS